jgi:hypothetical protein
MEVALFQANLDLLTNVETFVKVATGVLKIDVQALTKDAEGKPNKCKTSPFCRIT